MRYSLQELLAPAVLERMTLVLNHVLGSEAVATDRLRPHTGRTLELHLVGWPSLLPRPPSLAWRVTPAGLLEWRGAAQGAASDLRVNLDAANPAMLLARLAAGEPPSVQIDGDAQLAGDVNWLITHLRWDVAADLERLFGPVVGAQLHRLGSALAGALRSALGGAGRLSERWRRPAA